MKIIVFIFIFVQAGGTLSYQVLMKLYLSGVEITELPLDSTNHCTITKNKVPHRGTLFNLTLTTMW